MEPLTIYEWMLLNGDALADAIVQDGQLDGERSNPMLTEAQGATRPGRSFNQARKLLRSKLAERGLGHLMSP